MVTNQVADHPEIPHGSFCYSGGKLCPHWLALSQGGACCSLIQITSIPGDLFYSLCEGTKECGINEPEHLPAPV